MVKHPSIVRGLRAARGWQQRELAAKTNLCEMTIRRIENDGRDPGKMPLKTAIALAKAFEEDDAERFKLLVKISEDFVEKLPE